MVLTSILRKVHFQQNRTLKILQNKHEAHTPTKSLHN